MGVGRSANLVTSTLSMREVLKREKRRAVPKEGEMCSCWRQRCWNKSVVKSRDKSTRIKDEEMVKMSGRPAGNHDEDNDVKLWRMDKGFAGE